MTKMPMKKSPTLPTSSYLNEAELFFLGLLTPSFTCMTVEPPGPDSIREKLRLAKDAGLDWKKLYLMEKEVLLKRYGYSCPSLDEMDPTSVERPELPEDVDAESYEFYRNAMIEKIKDLLRNEDPD
jgi:hypothetical protein